MESQEFTPAQIRARIESKKVHRAEIIRYRDDNEYYERNRKVYADRIAAAQHSLQIVEASRNNSENILKLIDDEMSRLQQQLKISEQRASFLKMQEMQKEIAALTAALGNNVNTGALTGAAIEIDSEGAE